MVKGSDVNRLLLHVRSCVPVTESAWSCCSYLGHCASQTVSWPSCSVLVCLLAAETWTTSYSLRFRPHLEVWAGPCWCVLPWPPWSKLILCDRSAEDLRQTALYSYSIHCRWKALLTRVHPGWWLWKPTLVPGVLLKGSWAAGQDSHVEQPIVC